MSCLKRGKDIHAKGDKRLHATLRWCWKGKVLFSTCTKALRRKGHWPTMNLIVVIEAIKAKLLK